jgi:phospholipid/cholesterol/gamma-HCH transport system substrate-binding protein
MIARKYETIVGLFVVASLAALLIMVVIVAQQEGLFQEYVTYRTVFKNVSGLKAGSEVHLGGVTVGNVLNTAINPEGNITVTFQVLKKYSERIREDSRSTIGFLGLLGDKSLDLSPGTLKKDPIPPEGIVKSVEPINITKIMERAGPALEDLQKIINNLVTVTEDLAEPGSNARKIVSEIREIVVKVNAGKGSLGKLVNDPGLYQDIAALMAKTRTVVDEMEKGKGLLGTLMNDPAFKDQAVKTMAELQAAFANLNKTTADLKEAAARLPAMAKNLDNFLVNLNRAGKSLPGLVTQGETAFGDFETTNKAIQRNWLLRRNVPKIQEHTIRMDAAPGKD